MTPRSWLLYGVYVLGIATSAQAQQARSISARYNPFDKSYTAIQQKAIDAFNRRLLDDSNSWRRGSDEETVTLATTTPSQPSLTLGEGDTAAPVTINMQPGSAPRPSASSRTANAPASVPAAAAKVIAAVLTSNDSTAGDMPWEDILSDYAATTTCSDPAMEPTEDGKYRFFLGVATSAYQIEGATDRDARGESIWDTFSKNSGKVVDDATGEPAIEFYDRYKDDIALLKSLGIRNFRMSLSWPRIIPDGTGKVNDAGLRFYDRVITELKRNCIEPMVTLYHWDLPQKLYDAYNGWTADEVVDDFENYASIVFRAFGDKVTYWSTFNEPYSFCMLGYGWGNHAPGRCSDCREGGDTTVEPYLCAYNVVRAHARAAAAFRRFVPNGKLSINLNIDWSEPCDPKNRRDVDATRRHFDLAVRIFTNPLFKGKDLPSIIRSKVPAVPEFTSQEMALFKNATPDYFALNHYTSNFIKDDPGTPTPINYQQLKTAANGTEVGPLADSPWLAVNPNGLRNVLIWIAKEFDNPEIIITENGVSVPGENGMELQEALADSFRVDFYEGYLDAVAEAKAVDNVNVIGYYAWTLFDNFEWGDGYTKRFGIVHVDFDTQTRSLKDSALWLPMQFSLLRKKRT